ncbi:uncharacterized protein LOC130793912 [Actinidia eriantha]|uniref:uncharacterized protein LOC130793912 n=1 Tax=Actinidia eriantha TaxID=165200 RepID=UPI002590CE38|nr:uncharacterized protein LOC130793912 [Actinidia eriantha]
MEESSDQQPRMMHFCKVCNKGFSCGGALGGHMRAHGTEEHSTSEFRDKTEGNKRTYFLRTTTNRFVSHRSREDCGKSFLSGKYSMDDPAGDTRSFNSSTIKGKSTCASSEERELASCLVMLSNGEAIGDSFPLAGNERAKGNFQCKNCKKPQEGQGCFAARFDIVDADDGDGDGDGDGDNIDVDDDPTLPPTINVKRKSETPFSSPSKRKLKEHKCSICHRVFSSGQALGGHKRCHWLSSNIHETYSMPMFCEPHYEREQVVRTSVFDKSKSLDLNIPTLLDDNPSKFQDLTRIYLPSREKEAISGIQERSYCSLHDGNSEEYNSKVEIAKMASSDIFCILNHLKRRDASQTGPWDARESKSGKQFRDLSLRKKRMLQLEASRSHNDSTMMMMEKYKPKRVVDAKWE